MKIKKKKKLGGGGSGRGWGSGWWGQGGCEWRSEAFVKIQKKKNFGVEGIGGLGQGRVRGGGSG